MVKFETSEVITENLEAIDYTSLYSWLRPSPSELKRWPCLRRKSPYSKLECRYFISPWGEWFMVENRYWDPK
jgi:hypothetical protein